MHWRYRIVRYTRVRDVALEFRRAISKVRIFSIVQTSLWPENLGTWIDAWLCRRKRTRASLTLPVLNTIEVIWMALPYYTLSLSLCISLCLSVSFCLSHYLAIFPLKAHHLDVVCTSCGIPWEILCCFILIRSNAYLYSLGFPLAKEYEWSYEYFCAI